jgi:hypothetical protein
MMERIKISPNWHVDELVDPQTYLTNPQAAMAYANKVVPMAQLFRNIVGKSCTINNWWATYVNLKAQGKSDDFIIRAIESNDNLKKWSGLRTDRCKIGSARSAHKNEGAIDIRAAGMNGRAMFAVMEANARAFFDIGVRRAEDPKDTPSWLHMDRRAHETPNAIRVIDPTKFIRNILV